MPWTPEPPDLAPVADAVARYEAYRGLTEFRARLYGYLTTRMPGRIRPAAARLAAGHRLVPPLGKRPDPPGRWSAAGLQTSGPAWAPSLPVIIAGDLNTGPLAAGGFPTPTYQQILAGGFTDAWTVTNPGVPGMTNAFHAEDPYGPSVPDKRIDLVLVNGGLHLVSATLTGTSAVNGLWPSDHAGVIAAIQIPS